MGRECPSDWFGNLHKFRDLPLGKPVVSRLVYGGEAAQERTGVKVVAWDGVAGVGW